MAVPELLKVADKIAALGFEPEILDELVGLQGEGPFVEAAMLEKAMAGKIVLAHGPWQGVNRSIRHGKRCPGLNKGEMKGFLVAVEVLIKEIGVMVEPESEGQGAPTALFVNENLARFKFRTGRANQIERRPNSVAFGFAAAVGPENGTGTLVLGRIKEWAGVHDGNVISIEQEDLTKTGMKQGVTFELPAAKIANRELGADLEGIDGENVQRVEKRSHVIVQLRGPEVP